MDCYWGRDTVRHETNCPCDCKEKPVCFFFFLKMFSICSEAPHCLLTWWIYTSPISALTKSSLLHWPWLTSLCCHPRVLFSRNRGWNTCSLVSPRRREDTCASSCRKQQWWVLRSRVIDLMEPWLELIGPCCSTPTFAGNSCVRKELDGLWRREKCDCTKQKQANTHCILYPRCQGLGITHKPAWRSLPDSWASSPVGPAWKQILRSVSRCKDTQRLGLFKTKHAPITNQSLSLYLSFHMHQMPVSNIQHDIARAVMEDDTFIRTNTFHWCISWQRWTCLVHVILTF